MSVISNKLYKALRDVYPVNGSPREKAHFWLTLKDFSEKAEETLNIPKHIWEKAKLARKKYQS